MRGVNCWTSKHPGKEGVGKVYRGELMRYNKLTPNAEAGGETLIMKEGRVSTGKRDGGAVVGQDRAAGGSCLEPGKELWIFCSSRAQEAGKHHKKGGGSFPGPCWAVLRGFAVRAAAADRVTVSGCPWGQEGSGVVSQGAVGTALSWFLPVGGNEAREKE